MAPTSLPEPVTGRVAVRVVDPEDAEAVAALLVRSRAALAPWEPVRPGSWFTVEGQRAALTEARQRYERGEDYPGLVLVDGQPAGRMNLNVIVRGASQSATLGYWVDVDHQGRGVATAAVGVVLAVAFRDLGLHRVQAGTLVHNHASRRVLAKNGFTEIGLAPRSVRIAGRWQDHVLHQRLADDPEP